MPSKRVKSEDKGIKSRLNVVQRYELFTSEIRQVGGFQLENIFEWYRDIGDSWDPPTPEIEPAIHVLLRDGHKEAVEKLIAHDANVFLRNSKGELPIQVASDPILREYLRDVMVTKASKARGAAKKAMEADAQIAKELCEEKISELFLHEAVRHPEDGREARLRALVAAGADASFKSPDGMTALHFAARHRDADSVNLLLAMGADPFAKTNEGELPIDWVRFFPNVDPKHGEELQKALRAGMSAWEQKQLEVEAKPAKPVEKKKSGRSGAL